MTDYYVGSGVTRHGGTIASGSTLAVESGGTALKVNVDGQEFVYSGGLDSASLVSGYQWVVSGGSVISATLGHGAIQNVSGGASDMLIGDGGAEYVYSGGETRDAIIGARGLLVAEDGTVSTAVVQSEGALLVLPGSTVTATTVTSGGQLLSSGVVLIANNVLRSTSESVARVTLTHNEEQYVLAGGQTDVVTLSGTATQMVYSGGSVELTTVGFASLQYVSAGGFAGNADILSGGAQFGELGTADETMIEHGGEQRVDGGTASNTFVSGVESADAGAVVNHSVVYDGGSEIVTDRASGHGTFLKGGYELVGADAEVRATTINAGGLLNLETGGNAVETHISSGGTEGILADGRDLFGYVSSGALMFVVSGGEARGATIESGGRQLVDDRGIVDGVTVSGGGLVVSSLGADIDSATLLPSATIDLQAFVYASGGSATLNPTTDELTVSAGDHTTVLQLAGTYTSESFLLSKDGSVGTNVTVVDASDQSKQSFAWTSFLSAHSFPASPAGAPEAPIGATSGKLDGTRGVYTPEFSKTASTLQFHHS